MKIEAENTSVCTQARRIGKRQRGHSPPPSVEVLINMALQIERSDVESEFAAST